MLNMENRAITSGHEILGHGLGFYRGLFDESSQHINAVQMENLIRRNMGINNLKDGTDHGTRTLLDNPQGIPFSK